MAVRSVWADEVEVGLSGGPLSVFLDLRGRWSRNPRSAELSDQFAKALFEQGRREEALRVLLDAHHAAVQRSEQLKLESRTRVLARIFLHTEASKLYQEGLMALLGGRLALAEARFSKCLESEPGNVDVLARRGQVRWLLENNDGAFEDFSQAAAFLRFEPETQLWLGLAQIRRGERAQGVSRIKETFGRGGPEQRKLSFWQAALLFAQRESGLRWDQSTMYQNLLKQGAVPSWLFEESLSGELVSKALVDQVRLLVRLKPEAKIETDGTSGISLDVWQPERLSRRLLEVQSKLTQ